jgi:hypothetical protein
VTLPWTTLWRSDLGWLAHLIGIIGFGLMILSMVYSLRKRKWLISKGRITRWLTLHHWAGFFGGLMALVHTLGNLRGLGVLLTLVLVLVLASSGIYLIEARARRPLNEATAELARRRRERRSLDDAYRALHAWGQSATPQGIDTYNRLLAEHEGVKAAEARLEEVKGDLPRLGGWRYVHNVGTMMLVGLLLVHIWSKVYFVGVGS